MIREKCENVRVCLRKVYKDGVYSFKNINNPPSLNYNIHKLSAKSSHRDFSGLGDKGGFYLLHCVETLGSERAQPVGFIMRGSSIKGCRPYRNW